MSHSHSANSRKNHTRMHATSQTQLFPAFDNDYMYDLPSPFSTQSQYTALFTRQPLVNPPPGVVGAGYNHTLQPYPNAAITLSPIGSHGLFGEKTIMTRSSTHTQETTDSHPATHTFGKGTSVNRTGVSQQYRLNSNQGESGWTSPTLQRGARGTLGRSPLSDKRCFADLNMNPNMGMPIRIPSVLEYEYKDPKSKSSTSVSTSGSGLALRTPSRPRPRPYVARHDGNHKLGLAAKGQITSNVTSVLHCSPRSMSIPREVMELAIGSPTPSPMPYYASPPRAPRAAHVEMFEDPLLFPSFGFDNEDEDEQDEDESGSGYTFMGEQDEMDLDLDNDQYHFNDFEPRKPSLDLITTNTGNIDHGTRRLAPSVTIVSTSTATSSRYPISQAGFSVSGSGNNNANGHVVGMGLFEGNGAGNGLGLGLAFTLRN